MLQEGSQAPTFSLLDEQGNTVSLEDFKGRKVILYFYPKDDTPGCTKEGCDFRDFYPDFRKLNVEILGISKDSVKSHQKFKEKYQFPFPLLSDDQGKVCEAYGVWTEKSMYGRKYMGIERSTFLMDEKGMIQKIWRDVKVTGHIQEIQTVLKGKG